MVAFIVHGHIEKILAHFVPFSFFPALPVLIVSILEGLPGLGLEGNLLAYSVMASSRPGAKARGERISLTPQLYSYCGLWYRLRGLVGQKCLRAQVCWTLGTDCRGDEEGDV